MSMKTYKKWIIYVIVFLVIAVITVISIFSSSSTVYESVESINRFADKVVYARLLLLIFIYINWRFFTSAMRKLFRLSNRSTYALLKSKRIVLYMTFLDVILTAISLV